MYIALICRFCIVMYQEKCMGNTDKKKKKHPVRNTLLIILALIIIAAAVLIIANWKTVMRIYKGVSYSADEISSMQNENDKKTNELLNELAVETMRDLTDEERALLASGELSESDAISLIQGLLPPLNFGDKPTTEQTSQTVSAPEKDSPEEISTDAEKAEPSEDIISTETEPAEVTEPTETTVDENAKLQNRISEIIAEIYKPPKP